ncbi:type VII secretion protein EccB [Streptomyces qinzhouensis]|uniref:Type VII secretion protein EccB n=1 Tax=Streptomyces qinzhouensis TaxID=2599401 RepID=A0A5B8JEV2_9ACTN|nr:type VII secretion protein EccB [Streptomyces qinzhouensis]QDY80305.1 type VII secretion protein EccB [Streptomyces qinzhouensis]
MQNKRDQVQAHMFLMGRLTSSILRSDPDAPESPQGRTNRGIAIGIIIAILVAVGAFVVGLISPGKQNTWQTSGNLIVDKGTGARYLYLDGRLRPVRNYTSAKLLGGAKLATTTVSTASLKGTPRGTPVGIEGAPDELPAARDLSRASWQVCVTEVPRDGGTAPVTTLAVGLDGDGDRPDRTQGLLVAGPDGSDYLIWQGSRLRIDRDSTAAEALGYASVRPVPVSAAFLNALPAGPDLAAPAIEGAGRTGPELGGRPTKVGQLFTLTVPGADERHYVLRADGLAPLTATELALLLADPRTRAKAYGGAAPTAAALTSDALRGRLAPDAGRTARPGRAPETPPKAVSVPRDRTPCALVTPDGQGTRFGVTLAPTADLGPLAQHSAGIAAAACLPVDRVAVRPGRGALVRLVGAGGGELGGTLYLVTETGVKYRLATEAAVKALGYQDVTPGEIPALLPAMLPSGPDLTPEAAQAGRASVTAPRCASGPSGDRAEAADRRGSAEDDNEKTR